VILSIEYGASAAEPEATWGKRSLLPVAPRGRLVGEPPWALAGLGGFLPLIYIVRPMSAEEAIKYLASQVPDERKRPAVEAVLTDVFKAAGGVIARGEPAQMAEPRPHWKEVRRPGEELADFIEREFAPELAAGAMHRGLLSRYTNLRSDFYGYPRHHKMPEWMKAIPTQEEWNKAHPPEPVPPEELRRVEREARSAQREAQRFRRRQERALAMS
jgi:hypothetical protein